jgi:hypothetical protein
MYFITVDGDKVLNIYDGSSDYVHRITGEPIQGAKRVPDNAIPISQLCYETAHAASHFALLRWDGTKVVALPATERDEIEAILFKEAVEVFKANKLAELSTLTLTELEALLSQGGESVV